MAKLLTESTTFTRDAQGRYVCNTFEEALESTRSSGRADGQFRSDARPFDIVIIGGGTFGAVTAAKMFGNDTLRRHRILVLEAGPFLVPEHVQNLPGLGLDTGGATHLAHLRQLELNNNQDEIRSISREVWGLPWHSPHAFPGLAYCVGGRSLYWGGWSPELLDEEMPAPAWPASVSAELRERYFHDAGEQIGTESTNDYVYGDLQGALRDRLREGYAALSEAIPLEELPDHPGVRYAPGAVSRDRLLQMLGLSDGGGLSDQDLKNLLKLEAPLAVQAGSVRSGTFPINKFSAMPVLIRAARAAQEDSGNDDVRKRLMVVPNCHVKRLLHAGGRVTAIDTSAGQVDLPAEGRVIIALGTIESARLALVSFGDLPRVELMGQNLMAHLRSNINIRVPRSALPAAIAAELQAAAMFLKCRHRFEDGTTGTYHLQITGAGRGPTGTSYAEELNRTIPDLDTIEDLAQATDSHIVMTIRGIGEMTPGNPDSHVTLDQNAAEVDEYGVRRAYVNIVPSAKDMELWDAMDATSDKVAGIFANGESFDLIKGGRVLRGDLPPGTDLKSVLPYRVGEQNNRDRRDELGTTHHEAGTLRMGEVAASSVTDGDGRFHQLANAYAVGPSLFPTIGSPNPMLTGVAMSRRLADLLVAEPPAFASQPGFLPLLSHRGSSHERWRFVGRGEMRLEGDVLLLRAGDDLGLAFPDLPLASNFGFSCDFAIGSPEANSGVFFGSREPVRPVPDRDDPSVTYPYANQAYVPVTTGFEVQIDELARGNAGAGVPDGLDSSRTGAIYGVPIGTFPGTQIYQRGPALVPGRWYRLDVSAADDLFIVRIDGIVTSRFVNSDPYRGRGWDPEAGVFGGFVGFQAHTGTVAFANISALGVARDAVLLEEEAAMISSRETHRPSDLRTRGGALPIAEADGGGRRKRAQR